MISQIRFSHIEDMSTAESLYILKLVEVFLHHVKSDYEEYGRIDLDDRLQYGEQYYLTIYIFNHTLRIHAIKMELSRLVELLPRISVCLESPDHEVSLFSNVSLDDKDCLQLDFNNELYLYIASLVDKEISSLE